MIDIEKIKALLASSATGYDIELKTGISRTQIGNYRKDPDKVMKMSLENAMKLQNYYEEENKMDYRKEMENLKKDNAVNGRITVYIYENKEECLQELSVNADEPHETYEFMKEELAYLDDEKTIYSVDLGNGMPTYYDDEKEAYDSI